MDVIKTLHKCLSSKVSVHYSYNVKAFNLEKVLQKPSYSVMGRIVMFALLKTFFSTCSIL